MKKISCCGATNKRGQVLSAKGGEPRQVRLLGGMVRLTNLTEALSKLASSSQGASGYFIRLANVAAMVEVRSLHLRAVELALSPEVRVYSLKPATLVDKRVIAASISAHEV